MKPWTFGVSTSWLILTHSHSVRAQSCIFLLENKCPGLREFIPLNQLLNGSLNTILASCTSQIPSLLAFTLSAITIPAEMDSSKLAKNGDQRGLNQLATEI